MVSELANDYANFLKLDMTKELLPIHQSVDEMLTRLEEFETLMNVMHSNQNDSSAKAFAKILQCKPEIEILNNRVNYLHIFVNKVNDDMTLLERQVEAAEVQLGIPDASIKSLLKPFFAKISKEPLPTASHVKPGSNYTKPTLFKTSEYFPRDDPQSS
ncbi:biogenesis of lysosome-related organelles complex 1 subunit 4 [Arctopsyche grandis]|uniref:biogenesis of lysosome-related organelles complex 1 subunit 4 n=1 Tax=Arctopsyche grandis TaxID=121162 RepID=UPI00406D8D42